MFQTLTLENFQRHKLFRIKFDPQVTLITGRTDRGKSAVIRALAFVCLGRWDPCYVRHGKTHATITLEADGAVLFREKGKGKNVFKLNGKTFAAFAGKVPEQIGDLLKVSKDNFQLQLDSHFWFGDSAGEVSKKLNSIVNLELIDSTLYNLNSALRTARVRLEVSEERVDAAKKRVRETAWVDSFSTDLTLVERAQKDWSDKSHRIASVGRAVAHATKYAHAARSLLVASNAFKSVRASRGALSKLSKRRASVQSLISDAETTVAASSYNPEDFGPVADARTTGFEITERRRALEALLAELTKSEDDLCEVETRLKETKTKLAKIPKPQKCPTCGQQLPSGKKDSRLPYSHRTCISPTAPR